MKYLSLFFMFSACALMVMSAWNDGMQFCAIMAGIFAIYHKIKY